MVLGKLPVPGRPTIWITVGQGPTALAVGAGGVCLDIFTLIYPFSFLSSSLWETARYRLKYCLQGTLNPKQPTNQQPMLTCRMLSNKIIFPTITGKDFKCLLKSKKFFYAKSLLTIRILKHPHFPSNHFWVLLIACRKT